MKARIPFVAVVLPIVVSGCILASCLTFQQSANGQLVLPPTITTVQVEGPVVGPITRWEYKLLADGKDYEKELNKLGADGWEFAGTIIRPQRRDGDGGEGSALVVGQTISTTILKRPLR